MVKVVNGVKVGEQNFRHGVEDGGLTAALMAEPLGQDKNICFDVICFHVICFDVIHFDGRDSF